MKADDLRGNFDIITDPYKCNELQKSDPDLWVLSFRNDMILGRKGETSSSLDIKYSL